MKRIFLLLLFATSCASKPIIIEPVEKSFEANGSKSELYVRANTWFVDTFNSAKMVVQFADKEEGVITGKYMMAPKWAYNGVSVYQNGGYLAIIQIQVKDGATKITVKPEPFNSNRHFSQIDVMNKIRPLINDYISYMTSNELKDF
jgi:hypothetical protein